ncbi:Phytosulfokine [Corchorus capsularis]|uniref:Phytosulfokine n=1 Tax=Corchorus capsularis TaxID=210143 RepID=A0A1R3GEA8_COCAP|nr:Phytosulfokine [Corchorus capsularis]
MAKLATLFILTLFLLSTLSFATRSGPVFSTDSSAKTQSEGVETEESEGVEVSCEGVNEDECLMRRTLAAHLDYIYTQKQKP